MHISELTNQEITYTHQDEKTGEFTIFAVERINEWIAANLSQVQRVTFEIDTKFALFVLQNRGVEAHRLARLLTAETLHPITLLEMPDGTHLIVDGNHRYVAGFIRKEDKLRAFFLTQYQWKQFVITGVPDALAEYTLNAHSGIK